MAESQGKNIVVATLGITWEIIAEVMGLLCYSKDADLYMASTHGEVDALRDREKQILGDGVIDELWLITTEQKDGSKNDVESVRQWMKNYAPCSRVKVKAWCLKGISDIDSNDNAKKSHDLVLRVMAYANQYKGKNGHVFVSLSGGRKTMSSDIQDAAYCFGCDMQMHVISLSKGSNTCVNIDGSSISKEFAGSILPIALDGYDCNPAFLKLLKDEHFEVLKSGCEVDACRCDFLEKVNEIKARARYFYSSFGEGHKFAVDSFPCLYTLSDKARAALENYKVGALESNYDKDLALLKDLPKADVHCHLGGCLTVREMVKVASSLRKKLDCEKGENEAFRQWMPKGPKTGESWKDWRSRVAAELQVDWRLVAPAYLLSFEGREHELEKIVYGDYVADCGLPNDSAFVSIANGKFKVNAKGQSEEELDLSPYEILGDLQGTSLLCHKETLEAATTTLLKKSYDEGVRYIEVRCSPINYANDGFSKEDVVKTIIGAIDAFRAQHGDMWASILFIASRHSDIEKAKKGVELYKSLKNDASFKKYFRGFDLAGNESARAPKDMREAFNDVMSDCMNITIHAGETMDADSIWQAVYYLNAERIGHGLTLKDNPELVNKFMERRIGIEMCPSSNYQIVGFRDNYLDAAETRRVKGKALKDYPLKQYLDGNLCVSVNTDDPGISITNMTNELLRAGRLTRGGLSLWDVFKLIYNGFSMAFLPYAEKNGMIADMNQRVYEWLDRHCGLMAGS